VGHRVKRGPDTRRIGYGVRDLDHSGELETEGILVADIVREDRLVAGHGFSSANRGHAERRPDAGLGRAAGEIPYAGTR
jgi:hypothetical protein